MRIKGSTNVLAMAVGGLALAIFTTGTAVAATGQLVNIVDPTSGVGARVLNSGSLLTRASDGSGPMTVDGSVGAKIDPSANDVDVTSSEAAPLYTKPVQTGFGASISLSASNGTTVCDSFTIPAGRVIQLQTMVVGLSGPASPRAWLDFYALRTSNTALKQELEVPLRSSSTGLFTYTGQLATGFPIFGGGTFAGEGVPTNVRGCIRGPASGTTQGNLLITGIYLS